jgi:hypothetical protein
MKKAKPLDKAPFAMRFGIGQSQLIDNDFPSRARTALFYVLHELVRKRQIESDIVLLNELRRTSRCHETDKSRGLPPDKRLQLVLEKADWVSVFSFCERVYDKILQDWFNRRGQLIQASKEVRAEFEREVNQILTE